MNIKGGARVIYQKKTPSGYFTVEWDKEGSEVWEDLAKDLMAKKLERCSYIRSIQRRNNYDGTHTIIVNYAADCGGGRRIYTVKR